MDIDTDPIRRWERSGQFAVPERDDRGYIAESLDLLGDSRINVFVPVLAHRFAASG